MAYQGIGTGTTPNDNTGDSLFTGAVKINSNFSEIYNALGDGSNINLSKSRAITAGAGLTGGGNLSADITLNIGQGDGISVSADSIAVNNTVIRTSGNQIISGTLSLNTGIASTSGDALVIQNGGDLRLYSNGNAGTAHIYCDTQGQLTVGSDLIVDGNIIGERNISVPDGNIYLNGTPFIFNTRDNNGGFWSNGGLDGEVNINNSTPGGGVGFSVKLPSGNAGSFGAPDTSDMYNTVSSRHNGTEGITDFKGRVGIGSTTPTEKLDVLGNIVATRLISNVSIGTAPFTVNSTTKVNNLNVDLLDGIDSSRIVFGEDETKTTLNNNWNDALSSGFYNQYGPDGTGTPTESWYNMIGCRHTNPSNNYQMQISGEFFDVNNLYYRIINNNSPTSWYKIWHSGNDGSGSGLDADLLDGLQSSSANTPSTIVARDISGNFSAGTVTATTFSGNLANTLSLNTSGTGLSGNTTFNNSGASTFTVTSNATSANTPSTIVARDISGNFSAGIVTATTFSGNGTIPVGGIIMWNGTIAEAIALEPGWALCDGRSVNGKTTPDLRDKFIVGATSGGDNVYPGVGVGQTGGSADAIVVSHSHTATSTVSDPGHSHTWQSQDAQNEAGDRPWPASNNDCILNTVNTGFSPTGITVATTISTEGSSATNANLPPYYALAFIMRVA